MPKDGMIAEGPDGWYKWQPEAVQYNNICYNTFGSRCIEFRVIDGQVVFRPNRSVRNLELVYSLVFQTRIKSAALLVAPDLVIKATARHRPRKHARHTEIIVSVGRPNYGERRYIARFTKAGKGFPAGHILRTYWTKKAKGAMNGS